MRSTGRIMSMKNSNDTIRIRTRDLQAQCLNQLRHRLRRSVMVLCTLLLSAVYWCLVYLVVTDTLACHRCRGGNYRIAQLSER